MARLAVLVLAAALLTGCGTSKKAAPSTPSTAPSMFRGAELSPPRTAPPLSLRDAHGRRVTLAAQRGRLVLVTFLYTHCPDVCPLISKNLNAALRSLPAAQRERVRVLAVSVDPKGDTAPAVRAYEQRLHLLPQFRFLIGSRAELRKVWAAWKVLSVQSSPELVDHAAYTALVDTGGRERVLYDSSVRASQVLHDLRALLH